MLFVATRVLTFVLRATLANVPASPTLSPTPSLAKISRRFEETEITAAAALVMDPRSRSTAPSTSAFRNTVWFRNASVATILPVSKTISSPASKVRDASAAVPVSSTTALLLIRILSPMAALLPAVNTVDAPTVMLALMVKGLLAERKPPSPAVEVVSTLMPPARSVMPIEPVVLKPSRSALISMSFAAPIPPVPAVSSIRPLVADRFAIVSRVVPSMMDPEAAMLIAVPEFVFAVSVPKVMSPPKALSALREIVPVSTWMVVALVMRISSSPFPFVPSEFAVIEILPAPFAVAEPDASNKMLSAAESVRLPELVCKALLT